MTQLSLTSFLIDSLRAAMGFVMLVAFVWKLRAPGVFREELEAYRLLPTSAFAAPVAVVVTAVEGFLGICLIVGWLSAVVSPITLGLFCVFGAAVSINLLRRNRVRCGCFGADGELISGTTLARLGVLIAAASLLTARIVSAPSLAETLRFHRGLGDAVATLATAFFLVLAARWVATARSLMSVLFAGHASGPAAAEVPAIHTSANGAEASA